MTTKEEHFVGNITGDTDHFYLIAIEGKREYISKNAGNNVFPGPTLENYSTERPSQAKTFASKESALKEIKRISSHGWNPTNKVKYEVVSASVLVVHTE